MLRWPRHQSSSESRASLSGVWNCHHTLKRWRLSAGQDRRQQVNTPTAFAGSRIMKKAVAGGLAVGLCAWFILGRAPASISAPNIPPASESLTTNTPQAWIANAKSMAESSIEIGDELRLSKARKTIAGPPYDGDGKPVRKGDHVHSQGVGRLIKLDIVTFNRLVKWLAIDNPTVKEFIDKRCDLFDPEDLYSARQTDVYSDTRPLVCIRSKIMIADCVWTNADVVFHRKVPTTIR